MSTIITLAGCFGFDGEYSYNLIDYYFIYSADEQDYYMICKLSCENDVSLDSILYARWNKKAMFITRGSANYKRYYVLIAKGDELKCCNGDTLFKDNRAMFDSLALIYQSKDDEVWSK